MRFSAEFCRIQEKTQRDLAESATLESRKKIALRAATAWQAQAQEAEEQEAGKYSPAEKLDAKIRAEFAAEDKDSLEQESRMDDDKS